MKPRTTSASRRPGSPPVPDVPACALPVRAADVDYRDGREIPCTPTHSPIPCGRWSAPGSSTWSHTTLPSPDPVPQAIRGAASHPI